VDGVCLLLQDLVQICLHGGGGGIWEDMCYERRRAEACVDWFLSFGNRTQNSRVAGARPNQQPIGGSDPNHQGIWSPPRAGLGPVRNPVL
jgi:hypothetical protein